MEFYSVMKDEIIPFAKKTDESGYHHIKRN